MNHDPPAPAPAGDAPAGDAEQRLLAALAQRYAGTEFGARSAAADIPGELWSAAGVARPDPASVGRWLRVRKGAAAGFALANRKNRDGVSLWRLRTIPRDPAPPAEATLRDPAPIPRDPASAGASPAPAGCPEKPPFAAPRAPWWAVPPPPPTPAPGGAAERRGGASWWATDGGAP